ncbi:hypothetical protein D3C73_1208280 [compost metagenome]
MPTPPASTIRSASDTCLLPAPLNSAWTFSSAANTLANCCGWFTAQSFCGARRTRAPLAPPRLSEPRKVEAEAHAVDTSSATLRPVAAIFCFSAAMSLASINGCLASGTGSCQMNSSAGISGPR